MSTPDVAVVVEREVDVVAQTRLTESRPQTGQRTATSEPLAPPARRQQPERRREDGARPLLGPAVEAPRPLPRLDPLGGEVGELGGERDRRREVMRLTKLVCSLSPSGAQSSSSWATSPGCSSPQPQANSIR